PNLIQLYFGKKDKSYQTFNPEEAYQKLSFSKLSPIHEALTKLLSDYPAFYQGSGNFKEKYQKCITRTVKNAQKVVQGKISMQSLFLKAIDRENIGHHATQTIGIDPQFQPKVYVNKKS